jgi:type I restriction enzyme S subunit
VSEWPLTPLREVTSQVQDLVKVTRGTTYPLLGVKWYAEGPFLRETVTSDTSKATRFYRARQGQFIYNRLFAWKGSFGLVGADLDGSFVSNEFPLFDCDTTRLLAEYLNLHFRQPHVWDEIERVSTGTTASRNRWKEAQFNDYKVALPPLTEQRRIVDVIAAVDAQIEALAQETRAGEVMALASAGAHVTDRAPLGRAVRARGGKRLPKGVPLSETSTDHPYLRVTDMADLGFRRTEIRYVPDEAWPAIQRYTVRTGEIVISIVGTIGRLALVPEWADGANLTENAAVVDVLDVVRLDPTWLAIWLTSAAGQHEIQRVTVGTSQPKLALSRIPLIEVPDLRLDEQQRVASAALSALRTVERARSEVANLRRFRSTLLTALLNQEIEVPESYDDLLKAAS